MIWSYHYDCFYSGIPFTMVFGEDYDTVSFAVEEEYIEHCEEIAGHH